MKKIMLIVMALVMVLGLTAVTAPVEAKTGGKLVALTFDDGPGPYTDRLLDGLKERGVHVTFFMLGQNVSSYQDEVNRMYREGHQLANHSWDHPDLTGLSNSEIYSQIHDTNDRLDRAAGAGTTYLVRAPYGSTNSRVREAVGAPLIVWSVDPVDWQDRNEYTVRDRVVRGAYDGAIILLHDIHSTSVTGALMAIDELQAQGYEFVTVNELFRRRGKTLQNGTSYYDCDPNGTDLGPVQKPVFSYKPVGNKIQVTISAQKGASIYYSTENGALNQKSKKYTGPFTVAPPAKVWAAAAFNMNGSRSEVVSQSFDRIPTMPPLVSITKEGVMTLKARPEGAKLYYTLDGTAPTLSSKQYTGPVTMKPGTVVRACAGGEGYFTSGISGATYSHLGNFFRDVFPKDWFYKEVDQAAHNGYMKGMGDGVFAPKKMLKRGQLVTLLYRYAGEKATAEEMAACTFQDVRTGSYYTEAVCWANARGIVNGYEDNSFRPDRSVTRQEMSKIFAQFLTYRGKSLPAGEGVLEKFTDGNDVSRWAVPYVQSMVACGLLKGNKDGSFHPRFGATRAQAAVVLVRLAELEDTLPDLPEPTEPTEPSEPSEPSNPTEPSEPGNPTEPSKPANPTEPSEPTEPTEAPPEPTEAPTEPVKESRP